MRHQIRAGLRIGLVGAAVLVPLAALVAAPAGAADAPADGALAVAPATGNTAAVSPLTFTAGAACPAGSTNFKVTIKGAGFAGSESDGSTNAIGVTGIDAATLTVPIAAVLGMTWDTLAQDKNAAIPLSGAAAMRLICQNGDNESLGAFVTAVTFTPADGTSTFAAAGGGGGGGAEATPTPTPAPTGAATPTPTPAPTGAATPTPTPAASGTPTPTQDPDASPTPSPTTTETATPTPSPTETTVVAGVNLPATGANSGPLVLFGFMLLAGGTLMIIVSSTPVPANPVKRD